MASCERCWADAGMAALHGGGDQVTEYHSLLRQRDAAGLTCSPHDQAGPDGVERNDNQIEDISMTTTSLPPLPEYVTPEYLASLRLRRGCGSGNEGDCCVIQERRRWDGLNAASYDIPETDSLVVGKLLIQINDASAVWRAKLGPYLIKLRGSGRDERTEIRRSLRLYDWSLREVLPEAIDIAVKASDGDSEQTRELSKLATDLRAARSVLEAYDAEIAKGSADLDARADLAALAALADLAALAALAARAARAALAALAALDARDALAALDARDALADLAALADLDALADLAALADLDARDALAALADLAALAALADLAAPTDHEEKVWPRMAAVLDEVLAF